MSDIKLTPEMKAKIEEAKKTVSELSPDDLDGVAGGAGSSSAVWMNDPGVKETVDGIAAILKQSGFTREQALDWMVVDFMDYGINIVDLKSYLTEAVWNSL